MIVPGGRSLSQLVLPGGIVLLAALWFFGVLWAIATPNALMKGLPEANRRFDHVAAVFSRPTPEFASGALCEDVPDDAARAARARILALAASNRLTLTTFEVGLGTASPATGWLTPMSVRLETSGPYGAVLKFLEGLSRSGPKIFVSTSELRTHTSSVALQLEGAFYCSLSAGR